MEVADQTAVLGAERLSARGFHHRVADTAAGYATIAHLPDGATNFTTIELKSNFLGTATDGTLRADASAAHQGRTTQVWDATVTHVIAARRLRCFAARR